MNAIQDPTTQLLLQKTIRQKIFSLAQILYFTKIDDSNCEIQLQFQERKYIEKITKQPGLLPGGDYFTPKEVGTFIEETLKKQSLINKAGFIEIPRSGDEWNIAIYYRGDIKLLTQAEENYKHFGPEGENTLTKTDQSVFPQSISLPFWAGSKQTGNEEKKLPTQEKEKTSTYTLGNPGNT